MKNIFLTISFLAIISFANAADPAYVKKMKETLDKMHQANTTSEFINVANTFSMISKVAKDEWLPLYYHANIHINLIYIDKTADDEKKLKYLDIARVSIDQLLIDHADEAEVQALDGWFWISKIGIKPMVYGMLHMGKYSSAVERALAIEPENPRAIFLDLSNKIGKAEWFGSDISEYCDDANHLYNEWDNYVPKSDLHPTWGKDGIKSQVDKCK